MGLKTSRILIVYCFLALGIVMQAQEAILASGGTAMDRGGIISYSIGQFAYTTQNDIGGTITQGVQQPFEIIITDSNAIANSIMLLSSVYPNPTSNFVKLKVEYFSLATLYFQLYDMYGRLLQN